jgi:GNAT superfamily N-acetyltransferase
MGSVGYYMNNLVNVEKAGINDIDALVKMRLEYLIEDNGNLNDSEVIEIKRELPNYFKKHISNDLFIFVVREEQTIVACAFLLVIEKPMSPAFINGKTGTVLNVYTCPDYRHKGYARLIMETLLEEAKKLQLSVVDLKSTDDGYYLYKSVGFADDNSKYHLMKWKNKWRNIKWVQPKKLLAATVLIKHNLLLAAEMKQRSTKNICGSSISIWI